MGRHNKQPEGVAAPEEQPRRRNWVRFVVSVPLMPVLALAVAIGVVGYAFFTSQISLNFAGPPQAHQQAPQADAQDAVNQPQKRNDGNRAARGAPRPGAVIAFRITKRLRGGFAGSATITNRGRQPINGWVLGFKIKNAQVLSVTNAVVIKKGRVAWVKNLSATPVLPPGQVVRLTFTALGPMAKPSICKFNRVACSLA